MPAASGGHVNVVHYLVAECNADVNSQDEDGGTALMLAPSDSHRRPLSRGSCSADVNTRDNEAQTELRYSF
jgi:hypothetical protein